MKCCQPKRSWIQDIQVCSISAFKVCMDVDCMDKLQDLDDYVVDCNTTAPETIKSKIMTAENSN